MVDTALGGVGVPLGVVQHLLVAPLAGSLHPGRQPVHHDRLTAGGQLPEPLAQVIEAGDEGTSGSANLGVRLTAEPGPILTERAGRHLHWSNLKAVELVNLAGDTLEEVIAATKRGIQRIRHTYYLAYSFLRHCGLSPW